METNFLQEKIFKRINLFQGKAFIFKLKKYIFITDSQELNFTKKNEILSLRKRKDFIRDILTKNIKTKISGDYLLLPTDINIPNLIENQYKENVKIFFKQIYYFLRI